MSLLKEKEIFRDSKNNIIDIVFKFEKNDGSTHKIGIGEENFFLSDEEQKQIAINIFNSNNLTVETTEINQEI